MALSSSHAGLPGVLLGHVLRIQPDVRGRGPLLHLQWAIIAAMS